LEIGDTAGLETCATRRTARGTPGRCADSCALSRNDAEETSRQGREGRKDKIG
jgi:hypothetical protein